MINKKFYLWHIEFVMTIHLRLFVACMHAYEKFPLRDANEDEIKFKNKENEMKVSSYSETSSLSRHQHLDVSRYSILADT